MMNELLEWLEYIEDVRQERKVKHKLKDIIVIVLFATLANVDDWVEMEYFAHYNEEYLKRYIKLENGIHPTTHYVVFFACYNRRYYNRFIRNGKSSNN